MILGSTGTEHWNKARPLQLPKPSYWPATLALGNTLLLWGILTMWIVSMVGLVFCAVALSGWIVAIVHEHEEPR